MKAEDINEFVIEGCRESGATDVVASVTVMDETMVRFSNNQITVVNNLQETKVAIFACIGARKAGLNVVDLSRSGLGKACRLAVDMARKSPEGGTYAPLPEGPFAYSADLLRKRVVDTDPTACVDNVSSCIDAGLKEGAERMAGSLIARNAKVHIATSAGAIGKAYNPSLEMSARAFRKDGASGHGVAISTTDKGFHADKAGAEAGRWARLAGAPVKGDPGEMTCLMAPLVFGDIAQQVGRFSSGFYVDAGLSFLTDKVGQKIASECLSIKDDATNPMNYNFSPFDAEGLPTKPKYIVQDGILRTYLHNSATAMKFGTESTGNAGLINPVPYNLEVGAGDRTVDKMVAEIDHGVYVTNDWYLRYQNYSTGDFSAIPRDAMFLIENGEITKSIKELRMSDNVLGLLMRTESLSKEREWVKWWEVEVPTLSPTAMVAGVTFTSSNQ